MSDAIDESEVQGLQDAITNNPDVLLSAQLRHGQTHNFLAPDHPDVSPTPPTAGQTPIWNPTSGLLEPGNVPLSVAPTGYYEGVC